MKIYSIKENREIKCSIIQIPRDLVPRKKDGWNFNWLKAFRDHPKSIYAIIEKRSQKVHGVIQLINDEGMLIMELIELAPFNIGYKKEYNNIAGCLIAFGCRESLKLDSAYHGYLTFVSKSKLVDYYKSKYYATQTLGTRMYIDPISGQKLIRTYLEL